MSAPATIEIRFYFQDDDNAMGRHTVYLPIALLGSLPGWIAGYAPLVRAVTNCALVNVQAIITYHIQTVTRGEAAGDLHEVGVFSFATDNEPPALYVISIPGIKAETLMSSGAGAGVQLDPDNPIIAAFVGGSTSGAVYPVAPWDAGGPAGAGTDLDYTGAALTELISAYRGMVP